MKTKNSLYSKATKRRLHLCPATQLPKAAVVDPQIHKTPGYTNYGLLLILLLLVLFSACQSKTFHDEATLVAYLQEKPNGYLQQKTINGISYSLLYRPTDLLVQQELEEVTNKEEIENLREKYHSYMYFNLSISKDEQELLSTVPQDENEFATMVQQLVFDMGDKIQVYTPQQDTLEMTDYIYPRMYGMSKATSMLLVYPRDEEKLKAEYLNFSIEDIGLYTGTIKFRVPTKQLKEEPTLSFN